MKKRPRMAHFKKQYFKLLLLTTKYSFSGFICSRVLHCCNGKIFVWKGANQFWSEKDYFEEPVAFAFSRFLCSAALQRRKRKSHFFSFCPLSVRETTAVHFREHFCTLFLQLFVSKEMDESMFFAFLVQLKRKKKKSFWSNVYCPYNHDVTWEILFLQSFIIIPTPTLLALAGVTNAHGTSPQPTACSLWTAKGCSQVNGKVTYLHAQGNTIVAYSLLNLGHWNHWISYSTNVNYV